MKQVPAQLPYTIIALGVLCGGLNISGAQDSSTNSRDVYQLSDQDMNAVYGVFGVDRDDPSIVHISGYAERDDESFDMVAGYLVTTATSDYPQICIVDDKTRTGRKVDNAINWDLDIIPSQRRAWWKEKTSACELPVSASAPLQIYFDTSIPLATIPVVMRLETAILEAGYAFTDGVGFQNREGIRMEKVFDKTHDQDLPKYCARYSRLSQMAGLYICFHLKGDKVEVLSISAREQQIGAN